MKKIKALIPLLLISLVLTGCHVNDGATVPVSAPDSKAENISLPENPASANLISFAASAPSVSSTPKNDNSSTVEYQLLTRAEWEQIVTLFKDWSYLSLRLHPDSTADYCPECVDMSQFITEERLQHKGGVMTYTEYFYKVVSGDYSTENGFNEKLDNMFTEKFKERYLGSSSGLEFVFKDGNTYVTQIRSYSELSSAKKLMLSAEPLSNGAIEVTIVLSSDGAVDGKKYEATLVKAENEGFRIDDVNHDNSSFFRIPELFYDPKTTVDISDGGEFIL